MRLTTRVLCPLVAALAVGAPLLVATDVQARVLPPSNDDIANATVIAALPLRATADISQATWDFATDVSSCNGSSHSLWYSFTPATSGKVALDPSASRNGIINIDVFTGQPGALSHVGCGQGGQAGLFNSGFILNATAGATYWVMASTLCCSLDPELDLSVYPAVAPQATLSVAGATVDRGGNATVTGTLACTGTVPNPATVTGNVRQPAGRLHSVVAAFTTPASCAAALDWTALAQPSAGRFVGGPATVNVNASICNIVGCTTPSTTAVLRLHRYRSS